MRLKAFGYELHWLTVGMDQPQKFWVGFGIGTCLVDGSFLSSNGYNLTQGKNLMGVNPEKTSFALFVV